MSAIAAGTASAEVDLGAFVANIEELRDHVSRSGGDHGQTEVMVVVKADGYGHGMVACARAARAAGVSWLGVATPAEAIALREAGDSGRLMTWLYGIDEDLTELVAADVDVSAQSLEQISRLTAASATSERRARVHLKIDTGVSRNGATAAEWPEVCAAAAEAEALGAIEVVGVWSHFASADELGNPSVQAQIEVFEWAVDQAKQTGLRPQLRHLSNSAGALVVPQAAWDLVRIGIAAYGIEPAPGLADVAGVRLRPVMRLRAQLAQVKEIAAGVGVSYGHTWIAEQPTRVGLVPLGYADGIPRHASNSGAVWVGDRLAPIRGRICMDQFVVDLGPDSTAAVGDEVILFGSGEAGEPTAADWAEACGTIGYEIVTRIGARVPRVHINVPPGAAGPSDGDDHGH